MYEVEGIELRPKKKFKIISCLCTFKFMPFLYLPDDLIGKIGRNWWCFNQMVRVFIKSSGYLSGVSYNSRNRYRSKYITLKSSVADPGCLSRILGPGYKNSNKRAEWKKICWHTFFCSHKFHRIENYVIIEMLKKKFGPVFKELWNFLSKNLSLTSQKYGVGIRDPGPEIRVQGVKKAPDPDP